MFHNRQAFLKMYNHLTKLELFNLKKIVLDLKYNLITKQRLIFYYQIMESKINLILRILLTSLEFENLYVIEK